MLTETRQNVAMTFGPTVSSHHHPVRLAAGGRRDKEVKVFHHLLAAVRRSEPNEDGGQDVGRDTDDLCSRAPVSANDRQEENADGAADPQGT